MIVSRYNERDKVFEYFEVDRDFKGPTYGHKQLTGAQLPMASGKVPESLAFHICDVDKKYVGVGDTPRGQIACCCESGVSGLGYVSPDAGAAVGFTVVAALNLVYVGLAAYGGYTLYNKWKKK